MPPFFEPEINNYGDIPVPTEQRYIALKPEENNFHTQRILRPGLCPGTEETYGSESSKC